MNIRLTVLDNLIRTGILADPAPGAHGPPPPQKRTASEVHGITGQF
jgi:hypothetical protein